MSFFWVAVLILFSSMTLANDQDSSNQPVKLVDVFYNVDDNLIGAFTYHYGLNHILAIGVTHALVVNDIDGSVERYARQNKVVPYAGVPAVIAGGLVPVVLPLGLFYYGERHQNSDLQNTGLALGQAAILGVAITTAYKSVTGRPEPRILRDSATPDVDNSQDFNFGFLRNGIFYGWPSGHATIAFAMGTTLAELYPENDWIPYGAYGYAFFVAAGISTNIHWLSDGVAGSLIGYAIGKSVGRSFSKKRIDAHHERVEWRLGPQTLTICYRF
jgi:membrane-associated phospholipid phosphatase